MYRRGETGQVARALRVLDALRGFVDGSLIPSRFDGPGRSAG
jgi:hypothetical protein